MLTIENLRHTQKQLLTAKSLLIVFTTSLIAYSFLALLNNMSLLTSHLVPPNISFLSSIIPPLVTQYPGTVETQTLIATILTAALVGLNIGLLSQTLSFNGLTAAPGAVLGLTISGCAACTAGVVTIAGTSIGLAFLPLGGLELSILGIGLLGFSALYISEKDRQKICEL